VLEYAIMKEGDWDDTRKNWDKSSDSGSWTFINMPELDGLFMAGGVIGLLIIYMDFGLSTAFYLYGGLLGLGLVAFAVASKVRDSPLGFIDIGKEDRLKKLVVGGIVMGLIWVILTGLLSSILDVATITHPFLIPIPWLSLPLLSIPVALGFLGLLAPEIEERAFRQTMAPTLAAWLGITGAILISGATFGIAHFLFGASLFLTASAAAFGMILAYFTLRHQRAAYAKSAHITYNSVVLLLTYLIWLGVIVA
jgi:membrane protease YdiL (CAAX protease family)